MSIPMNSPNALALAITLTTRFRPEHGTIKVIRDTRNMVIEIADQEKSYILKIKDTNTAYGRMTVNEVDWIHTLYARGIAVPRLVQSGSGKFIEQAELDGTCLTAYCYEKLRLDSGGNKCWKDPLFIQKLGSTMGRMHTLAESYTPPEPEHLPLWDSPEWISDPDAYFHTSQAGAVETIRKLKQAVASLPSDRANCGIIHDDLHTGNVFILDGSPAIIDFECLHMNWFVAEIASTLIFRTWIGPGKMKPEVKEDAIFFLRNLLYGYLREHTLEHGWYDHIPLFLKLREVSLFSGFAGLDLDRAKDNAYVQFIYSSIAENRPFLDVDFRKVL